MERKRGPDGSPRHSAPLDRYADVGIHRGDLLHGFVGCPLGAIGVGGSGILRCGRPNRFSIMSTLHFIGGEKGGVGKSLVSRVLAQYLIDHQLPFRAFDTDRSHGSLLRFYSDYASPVQVDRAESLDSMVEAAVDLPEGRILVDLAAQTHDPLVRWIDESGVLELAGEMRILVRYWHVMDSGKDSVELLGKLFTRFGARLSYVLVLNQVRESTFEIFERSPEKTRAEELQAKVITLKRLHESTMTKIDGSSSSFWSAQNSADKSLTGLGLLERQRVKIWLRNAYEAIESVGV